MVSAIVLAAGSSSRMGDDNKLLLSYKNKPVVTSIVQSILDAGIKDIIVVTGYQTKLVTAELSRLAVKFVYNAHYSTGMTGSIQHGVKTATGAGYMICLADMVTITPSEYKFLTDAFEQRMMMDAGCICLPVYKKERGNPVIFSAIYKNAILQNREPEGCKNIVRANSKHIYTVDMPTPHVLQDFDYRSDYEKLNQL